MHYVSVEELGKSYGITPLFSGISFNIEEGDKIALIVNNGFTETGRHDFQIGKECFQFMVM